MATLHDRLQAIKTIRAGALDFKIVWDGELLRELKLHGQTDHVKGQVTLDPDVSMQIGRVTVVHEATRMIDEGMQLGMEEREVTLLANALVMLFRDNPWLKVLL